MKVLHILRAPTGGLFRHVRELARATATLGVQSGMVCDRGGMSRAERSMDQALGRDFPLGVELVSMPRLPSPQDVLAILNIFRQVVKVRPDVIHGHGAKGGLYARIIAKLTNTRVVYTTHGGSLHYPAGSLSGMCYFTIEKILKPFTDGIIFESQFISEEFLLKVGRPKYFRTIPHGISPVKSVIGSKKKCDIVFIGEIRKVKGIGELLDALSALGKLNVRPTVHIYGDGPDIELFRHKAVSSKLDGHVKWCGYTTAPARAMAEAGAVIVPSLRESFCYAALDALAMGCTVIASSTGALRDLPDGCAVLLVVPGDVEDLARQINVFLNSSPSPSASATCAEKIMERFSIEKMGKSTVQLYGEICEM